ncbi:GNAT family N-acetyltransferase [Mucilaginibacter sp. BT774]|uniref:GNAT family N-acetyltransferase n=1 Tax=Mucilaginibacter sp. BT774 TaxID=3062276 RepID=UPI002674C43C|nr:GNAT family N-acetyltransferase [Mucilaginibacter sp. BT774]MDO3628969.1 GNAT family N-acetyltransferase [Mucilaginibacter sp. BT774]
MQTIIKTYTANDNSGLLVQNTRSEHAEQLEELQRTVFPTLADDELILAKHYLKHLEIFPEGQFVITDNGRVIGMTSTMRSTFDLNDLQHSFKETFAGGWMTNHNPNGEWLYGLDIGIHPDYRGKGLARLLYRARHHVVKQLGLKGQITVGMMSGYGKVSHLMNGQDYYQELIAGLRSDPTLTPQMKIGFEPIALIPDYLNDPICGNYGVFIKIDSNKEI